MASPPRTRLEAAWLGGLLALVGLASLVHGCGESEDTDPGYLARGVQHLDPRLEDGSSATEALSNLATVRAEWTVEGAATAAGDLAPWRTDRADLGPVPGAATGVGVAKEQAGPDALPIHLVLEAPVDASEVNLLEIDLVAKVSGSALLRWNPEVAQPGVPSAANLVETSWVKSGDVQTLRFPLADRRGWRGVMRSLRVVFREDFILHGIRLVNEGFCPGHQPSGDFPEAGTDGGLLGIGGDERRTWPSDFGVPLFVREVSLPKGARATVACALPGTLHGLDQRVHFAIDVRRSAGAWEERAERSFVPAEEPDQASWQGLTADLADLAGIEVDLRLRCWMESGSGSTPAPGQSLGTDGELQLARVWWGVPMVLGQMHVERRPNLVLVTVDTTRTDAIGAYGGPRRTPFLDRMAAEGVLFESAWSACNSTLPSHASILTGLEVPVHGLLDNRSQLAPEVRTLAQVLREEGYQTAAAVSVDHLQAGYSGLGRGFDQYLAVQPGASEDGALTMAKVSDWLRDWSAEGDRPFFLWVHLFDPHTPYGPPDPWVEDYVATYAIDVPPRKIAEGNIGTNSFGEPSQFLFGVNNSSYADFLYQAGVSYSDALLERLDQDLHANDLGKHTALVVTSDHGESLGEGPGKSAVWYSHQMLFDPILQVPLLIRLPDGPQGKRVTTRVSTLDLAGSLSSYLGVPGFEPSGHELDLIGLALGEAPEVSDRRVWFVHSSAAQYGLKDDSQTYFENLREYLQLGRANATPAGHAFLFEPERDPGFKHNLAEEQPERSSRLGADLQAWRQGLETGRTVQAEVSAAAERALEALGYMGDGEDEDPD